jgi:hypothetical protein
MSPLEPQSPEETKWAHILMDVLVGQHTPFGIAGLSANKLTVD